MDVGRGVPLLLQQGLAGCGGADPAAAVELARRAEEQASGGRGDQQPGAEPPHRSRKAADADEVAAREGAAQLPQGEGRPGEGEDRVLVHWGQALRARLLAQQADDERHHRHHGKGSREAREEEDHGLPRPSRHEGRQGRQEEDRRGQGEASADDHGRGASRGGVHQGADHGAQERVGERGAGEEDSGSRRRGPDVLGLEWRQRRVEEAKAEESGRRHQGHRQCRRRAPGGWRRALGHGGAVLLVCGPASNRGVRRRHRRAPAAQRQER
mmetsp:Transcript_115269/g.358981  ORF Transcript_115269/g.358981 Transcript_115269/m.358981 type:complete len:269 (-) Transcript_115269:641-1447(-)